VPPAAHWPEDTTEEAIRKELAGASFAAPAVVMRGKPQGRPTYNVFLVKGGGAPAAAHASAAPVLAKGKAAARPEKVVETVKHELASNGGSWKSWSGKLAPFQLAVRAKLKSAPAKVKAVPGADGFLFFRNELESVVGGDLEEQRRGKNPLPVIIEFKQALAARGVDFLFVPVPNKVEVFPTSSIPDRPRWWATWSTPTTASCCSRWARPGWRCWISCPRCWPSARRSGGEGAALPGAGHALEPARAWSWARAWWPHGSSSTPGTGELEKQARPFGLKQASFTRYGDLHSRLAEPLKKRYQPETLLGEQVLNRTARPTRTIPTAPSSCSATASPASTS
jgi:alginate O-acetyltransferase complex protein AlgJ